MTRPALGLRMRVTLFFALVALTAGVALTAVTYQFARNFLLDERTTSARQQANTNAGQVRDKLRQDPGTIDIFFQDVNTEPDGFAFLTDPLVPTDQGFQVDDLPVALREAVGNRESGSQRFAVNGDPYLAIGLHLPGPDTGYIEAFPLAPTERTLRAVLTVLVVGTFVTTMLATFFGWSTSKRLLRPITRVADAAGAIASGGLDTRVEAEKDPDLDRLAGSFNAMVDAVQARIERERDSPPT
ncbi:MAG: HAMP domain-containing protein [Ilumatobacteraceae bacterium]